MTAETIFSHTFRNMEHVGQKKKAHMSELLVGESPWTQSLTVGRGPCNLGGVGWVADDSRGGGGGWHGVALLVVLGVIRQRWL
jgi:hypothetical protein